jgi:membrane fusion protein (multidrug efflux system)
MGPTIRKVGVATLLAFLVGACKQVAASERTADTADASKVHVTDAAVAERAFPKVLRLTGSLTAHQASNVATDAAGRVLETLVERGSVVEKGAILARLDASDAALAAREAAAAADTASTSNDRARADCDRADKLVSSGAISRAEYDQVRAGCATASSSLDGARARAARAKKHLGDTVIRAPFSGVVAERFVSVGEYVGPGTRIARIVQADPLRVEFAVPEAATGQLAVGQKRTFSVAALPAERFGATVRFVGPAIEAQTRNLLVEAVVDVADERLKPGGFVSTRLVLGEQRLPAVPEGALREDGSGARVFVVADGVLQERLVTLGERDGGFAAVLKGVAPGEHVVTDPSADLRDGVKVR